MIAKKTIIILFILVMVCFVKADNPVYQINNPVVLTQSCNNCTFCNITDINYPNSSTLLMNLIMTKDQFAYNYTINRTLVNTIGTYSWFYICGNTVTGDYATGQLFFDINGIGNALTVQKTQTYILLWVISFLIFLGLLIVGIYLPVSNKKDEMTGFVIAVSNLKYLKMFCLALSYVVLIFLAYYSYALCNSYLDMDFLTNTFFFMFYGLVAMALPLFIVGSAFTIMNAVRDTKLNDYLSRGLSTKNL